MPFFPLSRRSVKLIPRRKKQSPDMASPTGQEIEITLTQYKKLADGMGISINTLFEMLGDDAPVSLAMPADELSDDEHRFLSAYRAADDRARVDALKTLLAHQRKKDTSQSAI